MTGDLTIGQVARRCGLSASAIRYYESEGLIPKAPRRSGRRIYDAAILDHLLFVRLALRSGFRIGEVRGMTRGLTVATEPGDRWRAAADRKLGELDGQIEALQAKRHLLRNLTQCKCPSLSHFAKAMRTCAAAGHDAARPQPR